MLKPIVSGFSFERLNTLFAPIAKSHKIGLAVSGGADSLGLLLLANAWRDQHRGAPQIIVYCVNHGLRPQADAECQMVCEIASDLGFECRELVWSGEKPKTGLQALARKARYELIKRAMVKDEVEVLLTGHHGGDQVETVLMRLSHASGLSGLRGMEQFFHVFGVEIFRPLLGIEPEELAKIVLAAGLKAVDDPSNRDEKYERVRWRNALKTLEETGLSLGSLGLFAQRMGRAHEALEQVAGQLFFEHAKFSQFGVISLPDNFLLAQSDEIGIRVLSRMIFSASGGRNKGELAQLEKLLLMLKQKDFPGITIGECKLTICKQQVVVMREAERIASQSVQLAPGKTIAWDQRFRIKNALNKPVLVERANSVTRKKFEQVFGKEIRVDMKMIAGAPLITGSKEEVLGLGEIVLTSKLASRFIQADY